MRPEAKFVKRLVALFGQPVDADYDAAVAEYINAVSGQSGAVLDRAADHLARTHRFRSWPTVAECLDAVTAARRMVNTTAMALEPIDDFDGWWAERLARIRVATSDRQIDAEIRQIEPYSMARWIAPHRLSEAQALAATVRAGWRQQEAAALSQRMVGGGE